MTKSIRRTILTVVGAAVLPWACGSPSSSPAVGLEGAGGAPSGDGTQGTGGIPSPDGTSGDGTGGSSATGAGGAAGTGGAATGGASTGGAATGGANTGGAATGGASTGGAGTSGEGTGGEGTGGEATGGEGTGGEATGGEGTGGEGTGGEGTGGEGTGGSTDACDAPAPGPLIGWASVDGNGVTTTTGGGDAEPVTVSNLSDFNSNAGGTDARVICVDGTIDGDARVGSNKTIIGMSGARITGRLALSSSVNVIVRNLTVVGRNCSDSPGDCSSGWDAVGIGSSHHVWFDHCDVYDGSDGNFDINAASDFITVSWTKFSYSSRRTDPVAGDSGHRFSNLIGSGDNIASDEGHLNVTFHHVWWTDNVDQRMPRVRYGKVHVFNSLYTMSGNNYCIGVGMASSILNENNVFIGANRPVNTTSFIDARSTVTSIGNIYTNTTGAAVVDIGTAFTPPYSYTAEDASTVQAAVEAGVGPQ